MPNWATRPQVSDVVTPAPTVLAAVRPESSTLYPPLAAATAFHVTVAHPSPDGVTWTLDGAAGRDDVVLGVKVIGSESVMPPGDRDLTTAV
jgi:hypothetical protein